MSSISLKNVSLVYSIYDGSDRSLKSRIINFSVGGEISRDKHGNASISALQNINLEIQNGDRVALLGGNGAGKSTLLKIMAGIYVPQHGEVNVSGSVSTLFNIKLGIDPSATGYENIDMRGLVMGYTKKEIIEIRDEIAEFSELGSFLEMPVRTYSMGMSLRLAFAISTSANADILLLDEFIGAGDRDFMRKARARLRGMIDDSSILVTATHNMSLSKELCNKAVLLEHGRIIDFGNADSIINAYTKSKS